MLTEPVVIAYRFELHEWNFPVYLYTYKDVGVTWMSKNTTRGLQDVSPGFFIAHKTLSTTSFTQPASCKVKCSATDAPPAGSTSTETKRKGPNPRRMC